jgi:serine/threonine protein kinase
VVFRHKATNFICALKKIPKRIFEGEQRFINQLVREVKIQSYLDHPNIVQLYTFFSDEDSLYLILELCCSGNVYNTLRTEGRFSEERTRAVIKQACHAIEFMHDSDIIHRDIKP